MYGEKNGGQVLDLLDLFIPQTSRRLDPTDSITPSPRSPGRTVPMASHRLPHFHVTEPESQNMIGKQDRPSGSSHNAIDRSNRTENQYGSSNSSGMGQVNVPHRHRITRLQNSTDHKSSFFAKPKLETPSCQKLFFSDPSCIKPP